MCWRYLRSGKGAHDTMRGCGAHQVGKQVTVINAFCARKRMSNEKYLKKYEKAFAKQFTLFETCAILYSVITHTP